MKNFEIELLNDLKKECGITSNRYNNSIKILIKKYVRSEISKDGLVSILNTYASVK